MQVAGLKVCAAGAASKRKPALVYRAVLRGGQCRVAAGTASASQAQVYLLRTPLEGLERVDAVLGARGPR